MILMYIYIVHDERLAVIKLKDLFKYFVIEIITYRSYLLNA